MKLSTFTGAFASLAAVVSAAPAGPPSYGNCISQEDAETLVARYAGSYLLGVKTIPRANERQQL